MRSSFATAFHPPTPRSNVAHQGRESMSGFVNDTKNSLGRESSVQEAYGQLVTLENNPLAMSAVQSKKDLKMMKTYDQFDSHIERRASLYIFFIIFLQIVIFVFNCILPTVLEPNLEATYYQWYNLVVLSFFLITKLYFLAYAVTRKSPSDLFSFLILSGVYTCYMIFRNVVFVKYPNFYMTKIEGGAHDDHGEPHLHKQDPVKYWQEIALIDVIFCIAAMYMYVTLSKPAFRYLYEEAFKMLLFRKPIWSKYP